MAQWLWPFLRKGLDGWQWIAISIPLLSCFTLFQHSLQGVQSLKLSRIWKLQLYSVINKLRKWNKYNCNPIVKNKIPPFSSPRGHVATLFFFLLNIIISVKPKYIRLYVRNIYYIKLSVFFLNSLSNDVFLWPN